jgi:hypothetical protein
MTIILAEVAFLVEGQELSDKSRASVADSEWS